MVGDRRDRGLFGGGSKSSVRKDVVGGRRNRGQYGGRNVSGARIWLQVGETEYCLVDAIYQEPRCGWK